MRLFLSGELNDDVADDVFIISKEIDEKLKFITEENAGLEDDTTYGDEFKGIGIIPMILSDNFGKYYNERRYISRKRKDADIRLRINYKRFKKAKFEKKRLIYIKNIMNSIDVVIEKSKGDFKGEKLKEDILKALDVTPEQLKKIKA